MKKLFLSGSVASHGNYFLAFEALGAELVTDSPERCDGLLLPGGPDIHPRHYGQEIDGSRGIREDLDAADFAIARRFIGERRPIIGICRGMQLINVAFGGTLHQDIAGHAAIDGRDSVHPVRTDDPLLSALYGERFPVNSCHHQSVDRLGCGLRAIAWADDGCVEAIRHETLPVFAVQWHPERLCGSFVRADAVEGAPLLERLLALF